MPDLPHDEGQVWASNIATHRRQSYGAHRRPEPQLERRKRRSSMVPLPATKLAMAVVDIGGNEHRPTS
jgi:hypothetical protein